MFQSFLQYSYLVPAECIMLTVPQMVSNGNEGWRARGPYDRYAAVTYPFLNWMNGGMKGNFRR